jgi:hypothetical protein
MFVITGMHRSGTSLVARLLHLGGANLGDSDTLYPGDRWNPDGYFEQQEVLAMNRALVNGPWWKLAYFRLPTAERVMSRANRRAAQIRSVADKFRDRTVKDARFCLTLPAWLSCGAEAEGILICLREPFEVAMSLRRRDRITISLALRLWFNHCHRLLENVKDQRIGFVLFKNLLSSDTFVPEMERAFRFAGLDLTTSEITALGKQVLRLPTSRSGDKSFRYPPRVEDLWRELLEYHGRQTSLSANRESAALS